MEVTKDKLKMIAVILSVVLVGLVLFILLFSYIYKAPLELGACDLCLKLNPKLEACFRQWIGL